MIDKPMYQDHQISTGHYAHRGEFVTETGEDYIGVYHIFPNDTVWSGETRSNTSFRLYPKTFDVSEDAKKYRKLKGFKESKYVEPEYYKPVVENYEKRVGSMERFFVQKINSPTNTIMEISSDQFSSINTKNRKGINGAIWRGCLVDWQLTGNDMAKVNYQNLKRAQNKYNFIGLTSYIKNYLEFSI